MMEIPASKCVPFGKIYMYLFKFPNLSGLWEYVNLSMCDMTMPPGVECFSLAVILILTFKHEILRITFTGINVRLASKVMFSKYYISTWIILDILTATRGTRNSIKQRDQQEWKP